MGNNDRLRDFIHAKLAPLRGETIEAPPTLTEGALGAAGGGTAFPPPEADVGEPDADLEAREDELDEDPAQERPADRAVADFLGAGKPLFPARDLVARVLADPAAAAFTDLAAAEDALIAAATMGDAEWHAFARQAQWDPNVRPGRSDLAAVAPHLESCILRANLARRRDDIAAGRKPPL